MKIAIICDSLGGGGAQRELLALARTFNADVYTEYINTFSKEINSINVYAILSKKRKDYFSFLDSFCRFRNFKNVFIKKKYDLYIFIGNHCINLAKRFKPNIWVCNTPSRRLYLKNDKSMVKDSLRNKIGNYLYHLLFYKYDQYFAKNFDMIIAISNTIKDRIFLAYGTNLSKKVFIIYPLVDIDKFQWIDQGDFYLSTARLTTAKRVRLIVKAFQKMPNKKLIVISTGPEINYIKKLSEGYKNIIIRGALDAKDAISENKLSDLMGKCIATIYIPYNEDFGISPIEGMAAGKPCIGVAEGALREIIIHNKTGYLCPAFLKVDDLVEAAKFMSPSKALTMREDCEEWAKNFSKDIFLEKMNKMIKEVYMRSKYNR